MTSPPDYKAFSEWAIREGSWDGADLGGDAIQSKALECGIIKEVPYDPDIHGDNDCGVERGEPWLVFIDALSPLG